MSRITLIRFVTEIDYPPFNYSGTDGNPAGFNVDFARMLLTLVSSSNAENAETLWGFIGRYRPGVTAKTHPKLNAAVEYAIHYFRDFVQPQKRFREPSGDERKALLDLRDALSNLPADVAPEKIQDVVYEVGRREPFLDHNKKAKDGKPGVALDWFNMISQIGITSTAPSRKYCQSQRITSKPISQRLRRRRRTLSTMFHGSRPSAESTTPIRIDSNTSLTNTESGDPPRKRVKGVDMNYTRISRTQ